MPNASSQAAGEAMPAVDRRAFLRTAVTVSATAAAAGGMAVMTIPAAAAHPDAELLALGAEFDAAFAVFKVASVQANEIGDAFRAKHGPYPRKTDPRAAAYRAAYKREVDPAAIACDEAARETDRLTNRIRAIPAKTLAGVAVKARTLRHDLCKWGDDRAPMSDWDWDDFCLETFIRDMQAIGGGLV